MQTIHLKGNGQIREGRTEIDVPHLDTLKTFIYPLNGPGYHSALMQRIDEQELIRPTTAQVLSLVDLAQYNSDEPHCKNILKIFKDDYLWTATESLSFPEGVIVYDNIDGKMPTSRSALLELANSKDARVRLVEPGFKIGWMPIKDALENSYTIAQIGEEMLPVFERIAKRLDDKKAFVAGLSGTKVDAKRYTAVIDSDGWLYLGGDFRGDGRGGYASGVIPTDEASREK